MTLRETIQEYKRRANLAFFKCNICSCPDYRPHPPNKMDKPCVEPWPQCKCKHRAEDHQPKG